MKFFTSYISELKKALDTLSLERIREVSEVLLKANEEEKTIFICGLGGNASTASHMANDLSKLTIYPGKKRFRAIALADNVPLLTAWANDARYEDIFAEQLENLADAGDIAIGISGSGNSPNVLKGIEIAKHKGSTTVGFVGFDGGKLGRIVDVSVVVPSHRMEQIEDIHLLLEHAITGCLRGKS